ncbi:ABC transporter ATP-binding protein [Actinoplanes couchii]|uniref:Dipeptide/oligopeptide/nickel ABC transporter ATP-binding protein n=1 Tax=Actinoplanes couchii TaxID=403638 RepID=A0ABQ3XDX5_9ACTN|nr:ATP-binding cassette domain-containing protein [Actinoplanes couchii]MDR6317218.1 peptide/nickel transport system ATP-binding protein [Actinoplanes couchii]GID56710.1 dipeptide/oligopeptide/nickel ABC transporter ATP-binding protein [Actinoplanes couchii]
MSTLEARGLVKDYRGGIRAVDDVSFTLVHGRTTALVGQSGSGKSTIANLLLQLERPTAGQILLDGEPVTRRKLKQYRRTVQMVFQDPFASLNPFHTVAHHLARPLRLHQPGLSGVQIAGRVAHLLERVRLDPVLAARRPHELSGGQRQRVAIARALAPEPGILIADEPVSMLDVSIRLGVLNLLAGLQREEDLGVLYITHDLATARHFSDDILVMHQGRIVERGPADEVILRPQHEYTKTLADASPDPERRLGGGQPRDHSQR